MGEKLAEVVDVSLGGLARLVRMDAERGEDRRYGTNRAREPSTLLEFDGENARGSIGEVSPLARLTTPMMRSSGRTRSNAACAELRRTVVTSTVRASFAAWAFALLPWPAAAGRRCC